MNPGFNQLQVKLDQVEASGSFDPKSIHLPRKQNLPRLKGAVGWQDPTSGTCSDLPPDSSRSISSGRRRGGVVVIIKVIAVGGHRASLCQWPTQAGISGISNLNYH